MLLVPSLAAWRLALSKSLEFLCLRCWSYYCGSLMHYISDGSGGVLYQLPKKVIIKLDSAVFDLIQGTVL